MKMNFGVRMNPCAPCSPHRDDAPAAELVVDLALLRHEAGRLRRREEHGAGDDQRVLVFLAELLPERDVGEDALVLLEVLLVADRALPVRSDRLLAVGAAPAAATRPTRCRDPLTCSAAMLASGRTSASITRRFDFERSWLRSSRTVSRFASTSSVPPPMKPATSTRWNGDTSIFGWIGVSIGIS